MMLNTLMDNTEYNNELFIIVGKLLLLTYRTCLNLMVNHIGK